MTQHEKIIGFCGDENWHCQQEFWKNYIFSPHKRRAEIEKEGRYYFEERPCEHGVDKSKDFKMHLRQLGSVIKLPKQMKLV